MPSSCTWFDFESGLSAPGWKIPFPAIATTYHVNDGSRLWLTHQIPELIERLLSDDTTAIGGHNLATFDLPIIAEHLPWFRELLWSKIERGHVVDTMIGQRQIQINRGSKGPLNLGDCARGVGIPFVDKKSEEIEALKRNFGQFIGATEIPHAHREYALNDAAVLEELFTKQFSTGLISMSDMAQLVTQQFDLALVAARGIRTDGPRVARLETLVTEKIAELEALARTQGFLHGKPKPDGTLARNMKAIYRAIGLAYDAEAWPRYEAAQSWADDGPELAAFNAERIAREVAPVETAAEAVRILAGKIPLTETGRVCTDRLTLEDAPSEALQDLSEWSQMLSIRNKDLPIFRAAEHCPAHTRFNIADTSRSTSGGEDAFNAQNFAKLAGVRECIRAREGCALVTTDLRMGELVGIAQLIVERLGMRGFADQLNAGIDLHATIGADLLGISYDEIKRRMKAGDAKAKEARDCGKPYWFGTNGGLSKAETFQHYARKSYGMQLSLEKCQRILEVGRARAGDQQAYLEAIKRTGYRVPDSRSERGWRWAYDCALPRFERMVRRGLSRTEASNNPFQRMCMAMAIRGLHLVQREQYLPSGRMHGSHAMMFTHDDIVSDVPLALVDEHGKLQQELLCQAAREICPDVFAGADLRALTHLSKGAEPTFDSDGRLQVTQVAMPTSLKGKK